MRTLIKIDNRQHSGQSYKIWLEPNELFDQQINQFTESPYSDAYPELLGYWKNNPAMPKRNKVEHNIFIRWNNW